jgi:hypothetical protein
MKAVSAWRRRKRRQCEISMKWRQPASANNLIIIIENENNAAPANLGGGEKQYQWQPKKIMAAISSVSMAKIMAIMKMKAYQRHQSMSMKNGVIESVSMAAARNGWRKWRK